MYIRTNKILSVVLRPLIWSAEWLGKHHPILLVKLRYYVRFHKKLDLQHPRTLNEKILYLSLKTDTSQWTTCADKYAVRKYVDECGCGDTLVNLYGVWDKAEDIDFDALPQQFVLKGNHGSGDVAIVTDKEKLDRNAVINTFSKDLKKKYGALEGGLHYMRIEPKVIAEELIVNDDKTKLFSSSLVDYKIWCFDGKPQFIWVSYDRHGNYKKHMLFDTNWNVHPEYLVYDKNYIQGEVIPKPGNFEEMLRIASLLSQPFPQVRCDLYNVNGRIYFGELSFTGRGGMMKNYTDQFQLIAGGMISLPNINNTII